MVNYKRRYQGRRRMTGNRRAVVARYPKANLPRSIGDYTVSDVANAAWSGVQYIKKLVNAEKHHTDFTSVGTITATTGIVINFAAIGQGDTISTRTGNSILCTAVSGKIYITLNTLNVNTAFRCLVVQDLQQVSDTNINFGDVLEGGTLNGPLNRALLGRFKVLKDMFFIMSSADNTAKTIEFSMPMQTHFRYNGTASTDIQKNGVYLMIQHSESTNLPSWNAYLSTHFYDN